MDQTVAKTILAQLGGNKFVAMTGAYSFSSGPDRLTMRLPSRSTKNGAWGCIISLNGGDLYDVRFLKMKKYEVIDLPGATDVYAENLCETFTEFTGMATGL